MEIILSLKYISLRLYRFTASSPV